MKKVCLGVCALLLTFGAIADDTNIDISLLVGAGGSDDFITTNAEEHTLSTESKSHVALVINYLESYKNNSRLQYELYLGKTGVELEQKDVVTEGEEGDVDSENVVTTDVDIEYYQIGGINEIELKDSSFHPFVAATVGATRMKPEGYDTETDFSFSIGTGFKWKPTENFGARVDIRAFGTVLSKDDAVFCNDGSCAAVVDDTIFFQYQATAGIMFRF